MTYTIITGSTSGIGKELAFIYAKNGFNLILVARRINVLEDIKKQIQALYDVSVVCVSCDLSSLENTNAVFNDLSNRYSINCLINNAGIAFFKPVKETVIEEMLLETNLNVLVPIITTKACLENIKNNNGSIINVCSILSHLPNVNASVYVATKHALLGFSNSLRIEEPDLHVLTVHPATVKTNFFKDADYLQEKKNVLNADYVAKSIYKGHIRRRRAIYLPKTIPLLKGLYLFIPKMIDFLNKRFYSKK